MNPRKLLAVVFSIILACMVFLPAAVAGEWDQATKMNFSEPVEIPGVVLPAGSYWFVLADSQGDQQIVQIFNADRTKIYATEETVPTERLQATEWSGIEVRGTSPPTAGSSFEVVLSRALGRTGIPVPAESGKRPHA